MHIHNCSLSFLGCSHGSNTGVLSSNLIVKFLVLEALIGRTDVVLLSHLEVLAEVLVSAPPVGVDHADSLVSSNLMEVGVSNIVLLSIRWESSVGVRAVVMLVNLSDVPFPFGNHTFFLLLGEQVKDE